MPHQEQEQEQEQEQDRKQRSVSSERSSADAPDPSEPAPGPPCDEKRHRQSGKKPTTHGIGSIVASVPLADGSDAPVTDDIVAEWTKAFPGVNVLEQLGRIRVYFLTNPQKRKTAAGIGRCITGWLSREQDRGGPRRETFRSRAPDFQPPVIPGKYAGLETVIKVEPVQPSDRKENIQ